MPAQRQHPLTGLPRLMVDDLRQSQPDSKAQETDHAAQKGLVKTIA